MQPSEVDYVEAHGNRGRCWATRSARGTVHRGRPEGILVAHRLWSSISPPRLRLESRVKTVLAVQHGQIPPNQHFETANPGTFPFTDEAAHENETTLASLVVTVGR